MDEVWPTSSDLERLDAVIGRSLDKMFLVSGTKLQRTYLSRSATTREINGQCDGCIKQHRPTNTECSMWLGVDTYATESGVLYDPVTRKPHPEWTLAVVDSRHGKRIRKETWEKV